MQTFNTKNTSAIRIMSIQFPGFLLTAAIPQVGPAGLATPPQAGLSSLSLLLSSQVRREVEWLILMPFTF